VAPAVPTGRENLHNCEVNVSRALRELPPRMARLRIVIVFRHGATMDAREIATTNEILRGVVGSTAHGTAIDGQDDRDEMGVFAEPPENVCGLMPCERYIYRDKPKGVRSGSGDLKNIREHDAVIRVLGEFAIIRARTSYQKRDGTQGAGRYTDDWQLRDRRWQCVSAHVSRA
jgi:hypothetical protein